jgi:hypothetical protein
MIDYNGLAAAYHLLCEQPLSSPVMKLLTAGYDRIGAEDAETSYFNENR